MNHLVRIWVVMAVLVAVAFEASRASAQPAPKPAATKTAPKPATRAPAVPATTAKTFALPVAPPSPYRRLAQGILEPVDLDQVNDDTVSKHDATEILAVDSNFEWAKDVSFRHDVWVLQLKFKPMRMIWADVPGTEGRMQRKLVWYMIYTVTNPGKALHAVEDADKTYKLETYDKSIRFIPVFTLEVHNRLQDEAPGSAKVYREEYVPVALPAIRAREDRNRSFRTTVEMPQKEIAVGETAWGIATWTDIDPRNVWFSVYVEGLTNAYRWKDDPAKFTESGGKTPYRELFAKVLQLNFWRPGDEYSQKESQIRYGTPGQKDYDWVWRRVY